MGDNTVTKTRATGGEQAYRLFTADNRPLNLGNAEMCFMMAPRATKIFGAPSQEIPLSEDEFQSVCNGIKSNSLQKICQREKNNCNELANRPQASFCGRLLSSCTEQLNHHESKINDEGEKNTEMKEKTPPTEHLKASTCIDGNAYLRALTSVSNVRGAELPSSKISNRISAAQYRCVADKGSFMLVDISPLRKGKHPTGITIWVDEQGLSHSALENIPLGVKILLGIDDQNLKSGSKTPGKGLAIEAFKRLYHCELNNDAKCIKTEREQLAASLDAIEKAKEMEKNEKNKKWSKKFIVEGNKFWAASAELLRVATEEDKWPGGIDVHDLEIIFNRNAAIKITPDANDMESCQKFFAQSKEAFLELVYDYSGYQTILDRQRAVAGISATIRKTGCMDDGTWEKRLYLHSPTLRDLLADKGLEDDLNDYSYAGNQRVQSNPNLYMETGWGTKISVDEGKCMTPEERSKAREEEDREKSRERMERRLSR